MPETAAELIQRLTSTMIAVNSAAEQFKLQQSKAGSHPELEADWSKWLKTVGPRTFTSDFSEFQLHYWQWYWLVTEKRRKNIRLNDDELAYLAIWGRGLAKSSCVEWSAIGEGAFFGRGYVCYVSATQEQAEEHVAEIKRRLESEEVAKYYPGLADPAISEHGNQYGWRQNFLLTKSGWAIRPIGLNTNVRGGRVADLRPTMIIFDDIDELDDSPAVVQKKIARISGSIIPAGTPDTLKLVAQNLIHRNSVVNRIHTRKIDILAERITNGPIPAFKDLEIEVRQTDDGPRNIIVAGEPTWEHLDIKACQRFLNDSGRERFLAEYQHDFHAIEQGRVIPEYDEDVHVISWSQFEKVFGCRYIPKRWNIDIGHDVGFTVGHQSAVTWIATSGMASAQPNMKFRYRGMIFTEPLVDDMAEAMIAAMKPDLSVGRAHDERKQIVGWYMSHEAKSERMTYNEKHDLWFETCESGKTDGIAEWRHFLRVDKTKPHPFKEDTQLKDGKYTLGCPAMFDVVDDDQILQPRDDKGLVTHRMETLDWRWKPTPLTDAGMVKDEPVKFAENSCDATRMICAMFGAVASGLTIEEQREKSMPAPLKNETLARAMREEVVSPEQIAAVYMARQFEMAQQPRQDSSSWVNKLLG